MPVPGLVYEVWVAWDSAQTGVWTWDRSTWDGGDVWGGDTGNYTYSSLGGDPQAITIDRGRDDTLATMRRGTCTVRLHDHTGKYAPDNPASPLYGKLLPLRPLRVTATGATGTFALFAGYITRIVSDPDYGAQQSTIEAADLFVILEGVQPVIANTGPTTTGAAIGLILDAAGWTQPQPRRVATGDAIPNFAADGTTGALGLIAGLLAAERGTFFIGPDGTAVYEDRAARNRGARLASQSTIAGTMRAVAPGVDLATIRNRATVTRTGGTAQTYGDAASFGQYRAWRDFAALTTPYLASDADALALAQWLVSQRKDAVPTARRLTLTAQEPTVRAALLARDLGDRVTATNALAGVAGDYHIEAIAHAIATASMTHETRWLLSRRMVAAQPWVWDTSTWDGGNAWTF